MSPEDKHTNLQLQNSGTQISLEAESSLLDEPQPVLMSRDEIHSELNKLNELIVEIKSIDHLRRNFVQDNFKTISHQIGRVLYKQIKQNSSHKSLSIDADIFMTFQLAISIEFAQIKFLEKHTSDYYRLYHAYQSLANLYKKYSSLYQKTAAHPEAKYWVTQYGLFLQDMAFNLRTIFICKKATLGQELSAAEKQAVNKKASQHLEILHGMQFLTEFCESDFAKSYVEQEITPANIELTILELNSLHDMYVQVGQSLDIKGSTTSLDLHYQNVTAYLMQVLKVLISSDFLEGNFADFILYNNESGIQHYIYDTDMQELLKTILTDESQSFLLKNALMLFYNTQIRYYNESIMPSIADDNGREKDFTKNMLFVSKLYKEIYAYLLSPPEHVDLDSAERNCVQIINMPIYLNPLIKTMANLKLELIKQQAERSLSKKPITQPATVLEIIAQQQYQDNSLPSLPNWFGCKREVDHFIKDEKYVDALNLLNSWIYNYNSLDNFIYSESIFSAKILKVHILKLMGDFQASLQVLESLQEDIAPEELSNLRIRQLHTQAFEMGLIHSLLDNDAENHQAEVYYNQAVEYAKQGGFISFATLYTKFSDTDPIDDEIIDYLFSLQIINQRVENLPRNTYDLDYFYKYYQKIANNHFTQGVESIKKSIDGQDEINIALKVYKKLVSISRTNKKYLPDNLFCLAKAYFARQEVEPSALNLKKALETFYEAIKFGKKHDQTNLVKESWLMIKTLKEKYGTKFLKNQKKSDDSLDLSPETQEELFQELLKSVVEAINLTDVAFDKVYSEVRNLLLSLQLIDTYLIFVNLYSSQCDHQSHLLSVKEQIQTKLIEIYQNYKQNCKAEFSRSVKSSSTNGITELTEWHDLEQTFAQIFLYLQSEINDARQQQLIVVNNDEYIVENIRGARKQAQQLKTLITKKGGLIPEELNLDLEFFASSYFMFDGVDFFDELLDDFIDFDKGDDLYQSSLVLVKYKKYWQGIALLLTSLDEKEPNSQHANRLHYALAKVLHWATKNICSKEIISIISNPDLSKKMLNLFKRSAKQHLLSVGEIDRKVMSDVKTSLGQLSFMNIDSYTASSIYSSQAKSSAETETKSIGLDF